MAFTDFDAAVAFVNDKNSPKLDYTTNDRLRLYALYKQATVGPCNERAPFIFNVTATMKHRSWLDLGLMSKEEAMGEYTRIMSHLVKASLG